MIMIRSSSSKHFWDESELNQIQQQKKESEKVSAIQKKNGNVITQTKQNNGTMVYHWKLSLTWLTWFVYTIQCVYVCVHEFDSFICRITKNKMKKKYHLSPL